MLAIFIGALAWGGDGLAIGLGARNSLTEGGTIEGVRALGQLTRGAWSVEAQGYGSPATERATSLQQVLASIAASREATFQQPVDVDRASLGVVVSWRVSAGSTASALGSGPVLLGGAEVRLQDQMVLLARDGAVEPLAREGSRVVAGPVLGAGFELDLGRRLGLRFAVADRMAWAPAPVYAPGESPDGFTLQHAPTLTLDLLYTARGRMP